MRWVWLGAALVISILAGASLALLTGHHEAGPASAVADTGTTSQPAAPPLTAKQAASLLTRLTSGDSVAVESVIAMPSGQAVPPAAVRGLQTLAPVTADVGSFREQSATLATMTAVDRT